MHMTASHTKSNAKGNIKSNTKVSFYILTPKTHSQHTHSAENGVPAHWHIAYRLCKKAADTGRVTVLCAADRLTSFSDFLWSQTPEEFLAHAVAQPESHINITQAVPAALINTSTADTSMPDTSTGGTENHADKQHIVINLSANALLNCAAERILEIIPPDEPSKVAGRERYKAYRQAGFALENHQISI